MFTISKYNKQELMDACNKRNIQYDKQWTKQKLCEELNKMEKQVIESEIHIIKYFKTDQNKNDLLNICNEFNIACSKLFNKQEICTILNKHMSYNKQDYDKYLKSVKSPRVCIKKLASPRVKSPIRTSDYTINKNEMNIYGNLYNVDSNNQQKIIANDVYKVISILSFVYYIDSFYTLYAINEESIEYFWHKDNDLENKKLMNNVIDIFITKSKTFILTKEAKIYEIQLNKEIMTNVKCFLYNNDIQDYFLFLTETNDLYIFNEKIMKISSNVKTACIGPNYIIYYVTNKNELYQWYIVKNLSKINKLGDNIIMTEEIKQDLLAEKSVYFIQATKTHLLIINDEDILSIYNKDNIFFNNPEVITFENHKFKKIITNFNKILLIDDKSNLYTFNDNEISEKLLSIISSNVIDAYIGFDNDFFIKII